MKKIEAFIRHEAFEPIRAELLDKGFPSLTISEVKGSGRQKGIVEHYRGSTLTVNVRPKLKIEVVVEDRDKGRGRRDDPQARPHGRRRRREDFRSSRRGGDPRAHRGGGRAGPPGALRRSRGLAAARLVGDGGSGRPVHPGRPARRPLWRRPLARAPLPRTRLGAVSGAAEVEKVGVGESVGTVLASAPASEPAFTSAAELEEILDELLTAVDTDPEAGPRLRNAHVAHRFLFPDLDIVLNVNGLEEGPAACSGSSPKASPGSRS